MPCPVTNRRLQTPFTRQTNTATPSRVTENWYKTRPSAWECPAARLRYRSTTAVDNQTAVCQGQRSRFKVIALLVTISGFILLLCSRLIHSSRYRMQQRDANVLCSVIAILRTPRVVESSARSVWHSANRLSFTLQRNSTSYWMSFVTVTLRFDTAQVPQS